jgi:ferredoxin-NADP reductase
VIDRVTTETANVRSLRLAAADGAPPPPYEPGQFVSVRLAEADGAALTRSYSLSSAGDGRHLRISVRRDGRASSRLHELNAGAVLDVAAPRGRFTIDAGGVRPAVFVSAGIGVTPVLAMLAGLVGAESRRPVTWIHVARSGAEHAHRDEAHELLGRLPAARSHVRYTAPRAVDAGRFDAGGRLTAADLAQLALSADGEAFVCGPGSFMAAVREGLEALGFPPDAVHTEAFGAAAADRPPHAPRHEPAHGPTVTFARSGLAVRWAPGHGTLLELLEACHVPVDWSCRSGVCHRCESGLVDGSIRYDPEPIDRPPPGQALLCCARPGGDVTLDL